MSILAILTVSCACVSAVADDSDAVGADETSADDSSSDEDDTTSDEEIDIDVTYDDEDDDDSDESDDGSDEEVTTVSLEKHATSNPIVMALAVMLSLIYIPLRRS